MGCWSCLRVGGRLGDLLTFLLALFSMYMSECWSWVLHRLCQEEQKHPNVYLAACCSLPQLDASPIPGDQICSQRWEGSMCSLRCIISEPCFCRSSCKALTGACSWEVNMKMSLSSPAIPGSLSPDLGLSLTVMFCWWIYLSLCFMQLQLLINIHFSLLPKRV